MVEADWAASRTHGTYLRSQFQRFAARQGGKRAAVAVAHSMIVIVYHLLADPDATFQELGGDYFHKRNQEQEQRRHVRSLESLSFAVTLTPAAT